MKKFTASLLILIVILVGYIAHQNRKIKELQTKIDSGPNGQKDLGNGVTKSGSKDGTQKDVINTAQSAGVDTKPIIDDTKKSGSQIIGVQVNETSSQGSKKTGIKSSGSEPLPNNDNGTKVAVNNGCEPNPDKHGYLKREERHDITEKFGQLSVPVGSVWFNATLQNPWSEEIKPRKYKHVTVLAEDEDHRKTVYSTFMIEVDGKQYKLPIESSQFTQTKPPMRFRWNPRLNLGVGAGINIPTAFESNVSLGISIGSYGQFRSSPDWYFGIVSAGYGIKSESFLIGVSPFAYKMSKYIPFTESIYISPDVNIGTNGKISILASIRLGL